MEFLTPILNFLLDRFMLTPFGVVFVAVAEILFLLNEYSAEIGFDAKYVAYIVLMFLLLVIYSVLVYRYNKLDKAKSDELGVLFICHIENQKLYKQEKYKMKEYFENTSLHFSQKVVPIFVYKKKLHKYNFKDEKTMVNLLVKTNCIFAVDIIYQVDDINDASKYELMINTAVVHPDLDEENKKFLKGEMHIATHKIKNQKFDKEQKLDKLKFTASSLNLSASYIIGLLLLLSGDIQVAYNLLQNLYESIDEHNFLYGRIKKAYGSACLASAEYYFDKYTDTNNIDFLNQSETYYNVLDSLYSKTYGYCLNMAALLIIKYNDVSKAKELIDICKKIGFDDIWLYSDAFLSAYEGASTHTILNKYKKAFSCEYNIVYIIKFIEDKLQENPNKTMLYLALGLLYQQIGDIQLMKANLALFNEKYKYTSKDKTCKKLVEKLLLSNDEQCLNCEDKCSICKKVA